MNLIKTKNTFWINSFFISVVYFFARRDIIRNSSLDADELITWSLTRLPWRDFFSAVYHDTQQPLYYLFLKIIHLLSPLKNDELLRYPSLLLSLGTVLVLYYYCSKYFDNIIAVLAIVFLVSHPEFKYFSVYARPYSLLYFLMTLNAWSVMEIFYKKSNDQLYRNIFFISAIFILFTHYLAYFYFFTLFLNLLIFRPTEFWRGWGRFKIISAAFFSIIFFATTIYQYQFKTYLSWISDTQDNFFYTVKGVLGASPSMPLTIILIVASFVIYFFGKVLRTDIQNRREILFLFLMQFSGIFIFLLFSNLFFSVIVTKYVFIFFPFYVLFLCHLFSHYKVQDHTGVVIFLICLFINFKGLEKDENAWKFDSKNFLKQLNEQKLVTEKDKILCNSPRGEHKIFSAYSEYFFSRDICTAYRFGIQDFSENEYDYIINVKGLPKDPAYLEKITNYQLRYSSRDVELLKKNYAITNTKP